MVGALQNVDAADYATVNISSYTAAGGMDSTIDGSAYSRNLSMVSAVVPGRYGYVFNTSGGFSTFTGYGTSFAAPQVGGAAVLVKDWAWANGCTVMTGGWFFSALLAMTDRYDGSSYRSSGFGNRWGGGRFQLRYFNNADLAPPWGWEAYSTTFSASGQTFHVPFGSGSALPSGVGQFKVVRTWYEDDNDDVADGILRVRSPVCGAGGTTLVADDSADIKSMVRLGSSAAGNVMCVQHHANHIPDGETRDFYVFAFFSGDTDMR